MHIWRQTCSSPARMRQSEGFDKATTVTDASMPDAMANEAEVGSYLCEVLAGCRLSERAIGVEKGTGLAGLTSALAVELARNVRGVCRREKTARQNSVKTPTDRHDRRLTLVSRRTPRPFESSCSPGMAVSTTTAVRDSGHRQRSVAVGG